MLAEAVLEVTTTEALAELVAAVLVALELEVLARLARQIGAAAVAVAVVQILVLAVTAAQASLSSSGHKHD
jgi:hypothetical protein